jgi:hypothetical protein
LLSLPHPTPAAMAAPTETSRNRRRDQLSDFGLDKAHLQFVPNYCSFRTTAPAAAEPASGGLVSRTAGSGGGIDKRRWIFSIML